MKNIRTMTVTPESGKDVTSTKQLSGQASQTKAWKEKNSTTQYSTSGAEKGALGGKPSGQ